MRGDLIPQRRGEGAAKAIKRKTNPTIATDKAGDAARLEQQRLEEERTERALQALYAAPSEDDDDFYTPLLLD